MTTYDFLQRVADTVRPLVLEHFNADSCIATTRIVIDVLTYFGVKAEPLPVEVMVFNREAADLLETEGLDAVAKAVWKQSAETAGGPWTLGLGIVKDGKWEGGHVVAAVPSLEAFIDASIDQSSRPLKHMLLEPMAVPVHNPHFLATVGEKDVFKVSTNDNEAVTVVYTHSPHQQFRISPNWRRKSSLDTSGRVFRDITARAIRQLKD